MNLSLYPNFNITRPDIYSKMGINNLFNITNPTNIEVYSIQHYVIEFDSDLRQVSGFLWVFWFPPPIKLNL
jgi:hypothetical protein